MFRIQRDMILIFHDLLGVILEVYIDDIVIKSAGLNMNPLKCDFDESAGKFLGNS
jgi:hypothetical protein